MPSSVGAVFGPCLLCEAARGMYSLPRSAGTVFGPWLLCDVAREGLLFLSLPSSFFEFVYTNYVLRLPGCDAKKPGGSTVRRARRERFSVPGCSRGSQGGCSTVCGARREWFSVPGCFAKQPGRVCRSFLFPLSCLLIIFTNYVLRFPGCYAKQPWRSTVCGARQARFSVPGGFVKLPGKV